MGCSASSAVDNRLSIHELYAMREKLGQGSYGQVRACRRLDTNQKCAVKIIEMKGSRNRRQEARAEQSIWMKLGEHKHITNLVEVFSDLSFYYFVMEKCEHSLCEMLLRKRHVEETDVLDTFQQMLLGIEHCHSLKIVHRDIKPANFLVTATGDVKLCDFGLAVFERPKGALGLIGIAGTAPFMSPEMVKRDPYNCSTDIWSFGATAYLMLYGDYVYSMSQDEFKELGRTPSQVVQRAIATGSPQPSYTAKCGLPEPSSRAKQFVKSVLQRDPDTRPTATKCLDRLASPAMQRLKMAAAKAKIDKVSGDDKATLAPTIRLVQQKTAELKTAVDPTVAKSMDQLLEQLQRQFRGSIGRSFTLPNVADKSISMSLQCSRSMSHGGEISVFTMRLSDELSEGSTTASSGSSPRSAVGTRSAVAHI